MDDLPSKRKFEGVAGGPKKAAKMGGGGGKMSFAQKMMAKMGYVEGQGLGKEGEGMVNPIEVKMRPQGAGVGTIKEKTAQYKEEQKRAAERRGEEYEGSSEEERRARRARRKKAQGGAASGSGTSTPGGGRKPKTKFKTVADVQAAAPGLDVPPQMLSSIIDATGSGTKMLTSAAGLMTPTGLPSDSEADKIAKRERMELEAFIEAWHGIQEQKIYIEEHAGQHQVALDQEKDELEKLQAVTEAVEALKLIPRGVDEDPDSNEPANSSWGILITKLESIEKSNRHEIERYGLSEAAVGALTSPFKERLADWEPLRKPDKLVHDLEKVRDILGLETQTDLSTTNGHTDLDDPYRRTRRQKATSSYETLIYTVWLPKMRTAVTNWTVLDHEAMTAVVQAWRPLLPAFVYSHLMDQLIVPKLASGLQSWDARKRSHHYKHTTVKHAQPHTWIFPWLPYLAPYQLNPRLPNGLLVDVKRKLRQVLDAWNVASGVVPGLSEWRGLLHSEFDHILVRHLLPRLAFHLSKHFEVDPSDQDLTPLEDVLKWQDLFKTDVLARLMVAEFFPKWISTLHLWLTTEDANLEEIGEWFRWWKQQLPEKLNDHPDILREWQRGDEMINAALDLLDAGASMSELPPPRAGPAKPVAKEIERKIETQATSSPKPQLEVGHFRDVVETFCEEHDLTLVPLREAHPRNGLPLFRITASATGKGGVIAYFQGDIVWVQKKSDRAVYEPIGLGDRLVERAEGK